FTKFTSTLPVVGPPAVPGVPAPTQIVTLTNGSNGGTLTITSVTTAGAGCGNFAITTPPIPNVLNGCDPFAIQVDYTRSVPGTDQCTITVGYTPSGGAPTTRAFALSGAAQ